MDKKQAILTAKRLYRRDYRKRNRDKINAYQRRWRRSNPDRVKQHNDRFWLKRAIDLNLI